jgi:hypothetical protein
MKDGPGPLSPGFLCLGIVHILDQIILSRGAVLCIVGCLETSLTSTY